MIQVPEGELLAFLFKAVATAALVLVFVGGLLWRAITGSAGLSW